MKVDLPEFKRCCFCLPLRYGLITWGYIKLAFLLLVTVSISFHLYYFVYVELSTNRYVYVEDIVLSSLLLLVILMEISFVIVFLVGGHRKSEKLLHIYYIYSIVMLCLFVFLFTVCTGMQLAAMGYYVNRIPNGYSTLMTYMQINILNGLLVIAIDGYIILLIRSEVNKLRNRFGYRFGNPAVETQVKLEIGIDNQFEGIINEKICREDFSYNKM